MPCSICGECGHNRRTCPNKVPVNQDDNDKQNEDDALMTLLLVEKELRSYLILNKISELSEEKIKFYESCLSIQRKEFKLINLEKKRTFQIYLKRKGDNEEISYIGKLDPRTVHTIKSFTDY